MDCGVTGEREWVLYWSIFIELNWIRIGSVFVYPFSHQFLGFKVDQKTSKNDQISGYYLPVRPSVWLSKIQDSRFKIQYRQTAGVPTYVKLTIHLSTFPSSNHSFIRMHAVPQLDIWKILSIALSPSRNEPISHSSIHPYIKKTPNRPFPPLCFPI